MLQMQDDSVLPDTQINTCNSSYTYLRTNKFSNPNFFLWKLFLPHTAMPLWYWQPDNRTSAAGLPCPWGAEKVDPARTTQWSRSSSSFFSEFPAISQGFTIFGEIIANLTFLFIPTIEIVTFCLRGWCILGVFLLPAFTCPGYEHQDLLSPCNGMHVCRLDFSLYLHPKDS